MNETVWADIPYFTGLYQVSDSGLVRNSRTGRVLKFSTVNGYHRVCLCQNGKMTNLYVHRLVASAFIPNPENKSEVNHIDGNKTNNSVANLEWATRIENQRHAWLTGLHSVSDSHKKAIGEAHCTPVKCSNGTTYHSQKEAARQLGLHQANISKVLRGELRSTGGYSFERI